MKKVSFEVYDDVFIILKDYLRKNDLIYRDYFMEILTKEFDLDNRHKYDEILYQLQVEFKNKSHLSDRVLTMVEK